MKVAFTFILALVISSISVVNSASLTPAGESSSAQPSPTKHYMSWDEAKNLAQVVADHCGTLPKFKGILAISRGGLAPAGVLGQKLGIKNVRVICLESYSEKRESGNMREIYVPNDITDGGEEWLVVDDIADKGTTLKHVRTLYPKAHYVTLVAKPIGKPYADFSAKEFLQETWIVFPWEDK